MISHSSLRTLRDEPRRKVHVVSTGFAAPTRERCMVSVEGQAGCEFEHHYIEASTQEPVRDVITNQMSAIDGLDPHDVVVLLDGDDWLYTGSALAQVQAMHDVGAWVTYGSFVFADGRAAPEQFRQPYTEQEWAKGPRSSVWRASHLKTLRAGLFQRLRREDIIWPQGGGAWDQIAMFAALEMAGPARSVYCPEILCAYNFANSKEMRQGPEHDRQIDHAIRQRTPYRRIEKL